MSNRVIRDDISTTQISQSSRPRAWKRFAIGLASVAMLATGVAAGGTPAVVNAVPVMGFSYANSTFTVDPVADLANNATWVAADGVQAYTATLFARDSAGNAMTSLDTQDIVFSATGTDITISAVTNLHDGRYTATYTSKTPQPNSTAAVAYRGVKQFRDIPVCTSAPAITEFIPTLNSVSFTNKPLPTKVVNGVAQVMTYNPAVWGDLGYRWDPNSPVTVKGTGTPATNVIVTAQAYGKQCSATVAANGTWSCTLPLSAFPLPRVQWTVQNLQTGLIYKGDGYSAWQTVTVNSNDCGPGQSIEVGSGYTTPLAIDFSGTGTIATLSADEAQNQFPMGPNLEPLSSGWIAPSAGFLVRDINRNGIVDSIDELFGGTMGDGYKALALYDTNKDGVINASDYGYTQLYIWRDNNSNKATEAGELMTLAAAGVLSISTAHTDTWAYDAKGNAVYERGSVQLTTGPAVMNDVYFAMRVGTAKPIPFTEAFDPANSTFTWQPVPDIGDRSTWALSDGVDGYTLTITAKSTAGAPITNLNPADFAFVSNTPAFTAITPIVNNHNGTYTAFITSTQSTFWTYVTANYKGAPIGGSFNALFW